MAEACGTKTSPSLPPHPPPPIRDTIRPSTLGPKILEVSLRINPGLGKVKTSQGLSWEPGSWVHGTEDELHTVTQLESSFAPQWGTSVADDLLAFSFSSTFFFLTLTLLRIEL